MTLINIIDGGPETYALSAQFCPELTMLFIASPFIRARRWCRSVHRWKATKDLAQQYRSCNAICPRNSATDRTPRDLSVRPYQVAYGWWRSPAAGTCLGRKHQNVEIFFRDVWRRGGFEQEKRKQDTRAMISISMMQGQNDGSGML
jgi:hypothetical protein